MLPTIAINRAPVLALWAAVVAERLGFDHDEGLTLGKAVAGLNAQAKGRKLGIFKPHEQEPQQATVKKPFLVAILGRTVPALNTDNGIRATLKGTPIAPDSVERYLESKFGEDLDRVKKAMQKLAKSYKPKELATAAYPLYEQFRPQIAAGVTGWGTTGDLDLGLIEAMAKKR